MILTLALRGYVGRRHLAAMAKAAARYSAIPVHSNPSVGDLARAAIISLAALPLVPVVLLLLLASRPFRRYEFVVFRCDGRLSFLVDGLETVRARRRLNDARVTTIAAPLGSVVNPTLLDLYRQQIPILGPRLVLIQQVLLYVGACVPVLRWVGHPASDMSANSHCLNLGAELLRTASLQRRRLGIEEEVQHVVFSFSDASYYRNHLGREMEDYHARRNSDLAMLAEQLKILAERELAPVRVGIKGRDLEGSLISRVLLDGQVGRTEVGEIALISTARFGWSDASGAWWAWAAFGIPILLTNAFSLRPRMMWPNNLIYVPTLYRREDDSLLTFGEMIRAGNRLSRFLSHGGRRVERVLPSGSHVQAAIDEVLTLPRSRVTPRVVSDDVRLLRERLSRVFRRNGHPPNVGMASQFLLDYAHLIDD